jgi:hypothetical protein
MTTKYTLFGFFNNPNAEHGKGKNIGDLKLTVYYSYPHK